MKVIYCQPGVTGVTFVWRLCNIELDLIFSKEHQAHKSVISPSKYQLQAFAILHKVVAHLQRCDKSQLSLLPQVCTGSTLSIPHIFIPGTVFPV